MSADMDGYLAKVRQGIEAHGWMVQGVMAGGPSEPPMHYTVGLWPTVGFEIITIGLPHKDGQIILNSLARRVVNDGLRFTHGQALSDVVANYDVIMLEIPVTGGYMGVANKLYRLNGINIPAWQMVYPDIDNLWPWDEGSDVAEVPLLGKVPTDTKEHHE